MTRIVLNQIAAPKYSGYEFQRREVTITRIDKVKTYKTVSGGDFLMTLFTNSMILSFLSTLLVDEGWEPGVSINAMLPIHRSHNFLDAISSRLKSICRGFFLIKYRVYGNTFTNSCFTKDKYYAGSLFFYMAGRVEELKSTSCRTKLNEFWRGKLM